MTFDWRLGSFGYLNKCSVYLKIISLEYDDEPVGTCIDLASMNVAKFIINLVWSIQ